MTELDAALHSDWNDLWTRYKIYCDCLAGTGAYIKSYDEWLNS